MNAAQLRKAERAYRRVFDCPPSRREREKAFQTECAKASGPAAGSDLDVTLITGRTKNSQIVHVTNQAQKTIYGYHRSLCGASLAEMTWHTPKVDEIDCINCRKIAERYNQNDGAHQPLTR